MGRIKSPRNYGALIKRQRTTKSPIKNTNNKCIEHSINTFTQNMQENAFYIFGSQKTSNTATNKTRLTKNVMLLARNSIRQETYFE